MQFAPSSVSTGEADAAARALARWLAPYLAEELGLPGSQMNPQYDPQTCAAFVSTLGDGVLRNAETFFRLLSNQGDVDSVALARAINVSGPRNIPAVLTTPLKRRAKALSLSYPWNENPHGARTVWLDREGISIRMLEAVRAEKARRGRRAA